MNLPKKETLFEIVSSLEKQGWELIEIELYRSGKWWYACLIKNGEGLYLEFSDDSISTINTDFICPLCHAKEEEPCDCGVDLTYKKNIHQEYIDYAYTRKI